MRLKSGIRFARDMAKLIGVSQITYSAWENNRHQPSDRFKKALSEYFKCPQTEIFYIVDEDKSGLPPVL